MALQKGIERQYPDELDFRLEQVHWFVLVIVVALDLDLVLLLGLDLGVALDLDHEQVRSLGVVLEYPETRHHCWAIYLDLELVYFVESLLFVHRKRVGLVEVMAPLE